MRELLTVLANHELTDGPAGFGVRRLVGAFQVSFDNRTGLLLSGRIEKRGQVAALHSAAARPAAGHCRPTGFLAATRVQSFEVSALYMNRWGGPGEDARALD